MLDSAMESGVTRGVGGVDLVIPVVLRLCVTAGFVVCVSGVVLEVKGFRGFFMWV